MNRYEIDCYPASGPEALYLLSALEMARMIAAGRDHPIERSALIKELNEYDKKHFTNRMPTSSLTPDFARYFGMGAGQRGLRTNSAAFVHLLSFVRSQLERLPKTSVADDLKSLTVEDLVRILTKSATALPDKIWAGSLDSALHPRFRWESKRDKRAFAIPAYSTTSLKLLLCGISKSFLAKNPEAGPFYVVREARGVFGDRVDRLNLLVRELLWLRDTDRSQSATSEYLGYYFSAVENDIYAITNIQTIENGQVQLFGQKLLLDSETLDEHHFYLTMPPLGGRQKDSTSRPGLLCGSTTRARRPAAWKVVVLEPPERMNLMTSLETIIAQQFCFSGDTIQTLTADRSKVGLLKAAMDYLQSTSRVGVLAAHKLAMKSEEHERQLSDLRYALKYLVASEAKPTIDRVTERLFFDLLSKDAQARIDRARSDSRNPKLFDDALFAILSDWNMLESISLFSPIAIAGKSYKDNQKRTELIQNLRSALTVAPDVATMNSDEAP